MRKRQFQYQRERRCSTHFQTGLELSILHDSWRWRQTHSRGPCRARVDGAVTAKAESPRHDSREDLFMRYVLSPFIEFVLRKVYADQARVEDILANSDLDWTVFRPPRLTDKSMTGNYRTAFGQDLRGGFLISRADVAHAMLSSLNQLATIRQMVWIAY
jgi:putative NAD(P)-binding protein